VSIDRIESVTTRSEQDRLYQEAAAQFGPALDRLALAYEADANVREDLLQDIHLAIWRSFAGFDGRCSIRTWVYRVAHNAAASHVVRRTRLNRKAFLTLCEIERLPDCQPLGSDIAARQQTLERVFAMIHQLDPLDRQIIVAYLEDMDAAAIGEMTGLSPGAVATKVYRIKSILARRFQQGA
jgi:RNA polymerase sigma-70 factor (ECF subfamily)